MSRCDGRVVKALDLKSNGVSPRRFEPCSQRFFFLFYFFTVISPQQAVVVSAFKILFTVKVKVKVSYLTSKAKQAYTAFLHGPTV